MRRLVILATLFPALALAETPSNTTQAPEVPEPPLPVQSGEALEPDITIIRRGKKTIHEYRLNGKLVKVKVIPDIGPPYYMVDVDGDGRLDEVGAIEDVRNSDLERGIHVQQWEIYSW